MNKIVIVDPQHSALTDLVTAQLTEPVTVTDQFDEKLQAADTIVWLAPGGPVDDQVFDLIDQVDARPQPPMKIVMLSLAGINDEVPQAQLNQWYGAQCEDLILAHQYAVKMIDELEIDYTIVRSVPVTNQETSLRVTNEGQPVTGTQIGIAKLATVISQACDPTQYRNQSIGVSEQ